MKFQYTNHKCTIKANKWWNVFGLISLLVQNRILDKCGDADNKISTGEFVDPLQNVSTGFNLWWPQIEKRGEQLTNGLSCIWLYILSLNLGVCFNMKNWRGILLTQYM